MVSIVIQKACVKDVDEIVCIHQQAFKGFFLTCLGERFLKLYYTAFIKSGKGTVLCATKDGDLVGFTACSYSSRGFNKSLLKVDPFRFGLESIHLLFTNPKALYRLVRNMKKESTDTAIEDNGQYAELFSIAVRPTCQGGGIGRLLLIATEEDVKEHNNKVSLTTDYYNNNKTIDFYRSLGYKEYYDFITYPGRRMWRMIKHLEK